MIRQLPPIGQSNISSLGYSINICLRLRDTVYSVSSDDHRVCLSDIQDSTLSLIFIYI